MDVGNGWGGGGGGGGGRVEEGRRGRGMQRRGEDELVCVGRTSLFYLGECPLLNFSESQSNFM